MRGHDNLVMTELHFYFFIFCNSSETMEQASGVVFNDLCMMIGETRNRILNAHIRAALSAQEMRRYWARISDYREHRQDAEREPHSREQRFYYYNDIRKRESNRLVRASSIDTMERGKQLMVSLQTLMNDVRACTMRLIWCSGATEAVLAPAFANRHPHADRDEAATGAQGHVAGVWCKQVETVHKEARYKSYSGSAFL